jgi:predicted dehydrogenase
LLLKHIHAIIGFGGMGGWHYENVKAKIPEIRTKGVWDIRAEAREKAESLGLMAYGSLEALLNDPEIELVTIATPNNFHKPLSIACLKAGKNVICEKPVTMDAAELAEIVKVANESGKLFTVHQNRRWDKDYRIVKEVLASGVIGKPYAIESRVQGSRGAMHGWRGYKKNGGGMVYDWAVHLIDQMVMLFPEDKVVSVDAHLHSIFTKDATEGEPVDIDDNIKLFFRFDNGVSVILEMATNCFINQPRWHVSCVDGTLEVTNWACEGKIVKLNTDAKMEWADDIVYTEAGPTRTMAPRPAHTTQVLPLPDVKTDWSDYYKNIVKVLDGEEKQIVKHDQSLRVMKIVDAIFESARQGCGLKVEI